MVFENYYLTYFLGQILIESKGNNNFVYDGNESFKNLFPSEKWYDWVDSVGKYLEILKDRQLLTFELSYNDATPIGFEIKLDYEKSIHYYNEVISKGLNNEIKACKNEYENLKTDLGNEISKLTKDFEELLDYSPIKIQEQITKTRNSILHIIKKVESDELLIPLKEKISTLSNYLDEIDSINKIYLNLYKNLIKPIKEEGIKGIKVTVTWAIISIIITALISILITVFFTS